MSFLVKRLWRRCKPHGSHRPAAQSLASLGLCRNQRKTEKIKTALLANRDSRRLPWRLPPHHDFFAGATGSGVLTVSVFVLTKLRASSVRPRSMSTSKVLRRPKLGLKRTAPLSTGLASANRRVHL